jgi:lipid-A-disaccharide synthase-like uncharacterized protein
MIADFIAKFQASSSTDLIWVSVGLLGQLVFAARFIVQWIASERAGRSVVPVFFWYLSILGSVVVLSYGLHKLDPVIIVGQLPGVLVYSRNLWLIHRANRDSA